MFQDYLRLTEGSGKCNVIWQGSSGVLLLGVGLPLLYFTESVTFKTENFTSNSEMECPFNITYGTQCYMQQGIIGSCSVFMSTFIGAIIAYKWFTPRLEMRIQSLYIITLCCTCLLVTAGTILDLFTVYIAEWSLFSESGKLSVHVSTFNTAFLLVELMLFVIIFYIHLYTLLQQIIARFSPNDPVPEYPLSFRRVRTNSKPFDVDSHTQKMAARQTSPRNYDRPVIDNPQRIVVPNAISNYDGLQVNFNRRN